MEQINQYLIGTIDDQHFAIPVENISEVIRSVKITKVPEAPPAVLGIIDLGGEMIPVIDLRLQLGLSHREHGITERIIIFTKNNSKAAFLVDEVIDVIQVSRDQIQTKDSIMPGRENMLIGISKYKTHNVLHYHHNFFTQALCDENMQQDSIYQNLNLNQAG